MVADRRRLPLVTALLDAKRRRWAPASRRGPSRFDDILALRVRHPVAELEPVHQPTCATG